MSQPAKKLGSQLFRMRGRRTSVVLLQWANWLLLGVSWGMSLRAYFRLPGGRMALWLSVWRPEPTIVDRAWHFFLYPAVQTVVFFGALTLARRFFIRRTDGEDIANLKAETAYLELIFASLFFIHLQTSLILMSFGLGGGLNVSYLAIIAAVLIMLVPYYLIRRRLLSR